MISAVGEIEREKRLLADSLKEEEHLLDERVEGGTGSGNTAAGRWKIPLDGFRNSAEHLNGERERDI